MRMLQLWLQKYYTDSKLKPNNVFLQTILHLHSYVYFVVTKGKKLRNKLTLGLYGTTRSVTPLCHKPIFKENSPRRCSTWQL
jgi:hypothetical protein